MLVGLHGYGDDAERLADRLSGLRGAPYARLWLDGPFPIEVKEEGSRRIGRAWYQYDGDQGRFRDALSAGRDHVERVVDTVAAGHPVAADHAVLLGYSMGGYLAGWAGLQAPERWLGVVALATRVKAEALDPAAVAGQRLLVVHGEHDRFIGVDRARESAEAVGAMGAEVTVHAWGGGHGLKPEVAAVVDPWVREVLGVD